MGVDIGIDTGASYTRICGPTSGYVSFLTPADYPEYIRVLVHRIRLVGEINNMVLGLPCVIDNGCPVDPPHLGKGWDGCDISADIVRQCDNIGGQVRVVQDTEAAAWGFVDKAMIKKHPAMVITLSTGVGGAIVWSDAVRPLEIGHMMLDLSGIGTRCSCGQIGCVEADLSGTAVCDILQATPETASADYWMRYGTMLADFLSALTPLFSLRQIIFFGGLCNQADHFLPTARRRLGETVKRSKLPTVETYGPCDSIGAYGAKVLAQKLSCLP